MNLLSGPPLNYQRRNWRVATLGCQHSLTVLAVNFSQRTSHVSYAEARQRHNFMHLVCWTVSKLRRCSQTNFGSSRKLNFNIWIWLQGPTIAIVLISIFSFESLITFLFDNGPLLPRDAMHKRGLCRHAVPSVRLSVRSSVRSPRSCILSKRVNVCSNFFSLSGSHTIPVFPYQTLWQYSDVDF